MRRPRAQAGLRRLGSVAVISAAGLLLAGAAPAVAAAGRDARAVGSGPARWSPVFARPAVSAGSRPVGPLPGSAVLSGAVALKPRDPAALAAYAAAVTTPSSPLYEHYLGTGRFGAWLGPSRSVIAAVEGHLRSDGVRVTEVSGNGLLVSFTATAADAEAAFGTKLERYRLAGGGAGFAPAKPVALPASIAPAVHADRARAEHHGPADRGPAPWPA
jgi:hypothetical protein